MSLGACDRPTVMCACVCGSAETAIYVNDFGNIWRILSHAVDIIPFAGWVFVRSICVCHRIYTIVRVYVDEEMRILFAEISLEPRTRSFDVFQCARSILSNKYHGTGPRQTNKCCCPHFDAVVLLPIRDTNDTHEQRWWRRRRRKQ